MAKNEFHRDLSLMAFAGIAHLRRSLSAEVAQQGVAVGMHCLSPGMVLTNLLLEGASDINKQVCTTIIHPARHQ